MHLTLLPVFFQVGTEVITITAADRDGGDFGSEGIRYEMTGSDLFTVDPISGKISVAPCEESCLVRKTQPEKKLDIYLTKIKKKLTST